MGSNRIAQGDQLGALLPPRGVGWGEWEGGRCKWEEIWEHIVYV